MSEASMIGLASIVVAGLTVLIGTIMPAYAQGRSISETMAAMAQQPDASDAMSRTLFVGLAMIEAMAIYCFVTAMILLFANPIWGFVSGGGG